MSKQTLIKRELFVRGPKVFGLAVFCAVLVLTSFVAVFLQSRKAVAATNNTLNFQARLQTQNGAIAPDGFYNIEFNLYNVSSGGSTLWTETYYDSNGVTAGNDARVRVKNGYITVNLGSITAFPGSINWDQDLWITMNIGGTTQTATPTWDGEMSPRLKLTGVPYAFRAGELAKLNSVTGFTGVLQFQATTGGNQTFIIPDQGAAGTYTLLTTSSASGSYIQNSTTLQNNSNFYISGNGRTDGSFQAPTFDTATAATLNLGTANATAISIGDTGVTTTVNGALTVTQALTANLGATISGAVTDINVNSNFATNINTGTSTGIVTIGNGTSTAGNVVVQGGAGTSVSATNATGTSVLSFTAPSTAGTVTYQLPAGGTGGSTYGICTTLAVCTGYAPAATNGYVQLAPSAVQGDNSNVSSIFINKTGSSGNIVQLQKAAADVFTISNTGTIAIKNTTDSSNALTVRASNNNSVLNVDTSLQLVTIGVNSAPNAKLNVNTSSLPAFRAFQGGQFDVAQFGTTATGLGTVDRNGTTTLAGSGTQFHQYLKVGDIILVSGQLRTVSTIDPGGLSLTVSSAFTGSANGLTYYTGTAGVGTITTNGTTSISGSGTSFTTTFKVGDTILINGESSPLTVASIGGNTSLTTTVAASTSAGSLAYGRGGYERFTIANNGNVGIGSPAPGAALQIATSGVGQKGLLINAANGQTANLFEIQNSAGTPMVTVNAAGATTFANTVTASAGLTVTNGGNVAFQKGTDFSATGQQDDVNFGNGALIRLTGGSAQDITGIAGGVDGRLLTIINAGSVTATIRNSSSASSAANRITTGTGADISLTVGASISLIYDSTASLWRVTGASSATGGAGVNTIGAFSNTSSTNGATISGTTLTLTAADGSNPGGVSTTTQTFAGDKTFSGLVTASAGISSSGGAVTLAGNAASSLTTTAGALTLTSAAAATWSTTAGDLTLQAGSGTVSLGTSTALTASGALAITSGGTSAITVDSNSTGAVNIGTGASAKTVTIGNTTAGTAININAASGINLNDDTLVAAGSSATAFRVQNASNANILNVDTANGEVELGAATTAGRLVISDGSSNNATLTFASSSADVDFVLPALAAGSYTLCTSANNCGNVSSSLTDNVADALDIQEGTNNYININTTNGSEAIYFGNATTNPDFNFLGTGVVSAGALKLAGDGFVMTKSYNQLPDKNGVIIPLYYYPSSIYSDTTYNDLIALKKKYNTVPMTVIINIVPPINSTDANYTVGIQRLHGAGIKVLGYVDTNFTAISQSTAEGVINSWKTYYPELDGIFLDRMTNANSGGNVAYYNALTLYAHGLSMFPVIGNAGTSVDAAYYDTLTADQIVTYEGATYPAEATLKGDLAGGNMSYDYRKRAAIVYDQTYSYTNLQMMRQYVGSVYMTSDTAANPWDTVSPYLETILQVLVVDRSIALDTVNAATSVYTPVLDVASAGTLAIGNTNATTINIGSSAVARTINLGTGAAAQTVNVGSTTAGSTTTINGANGISLTANTTLAANMNFQLAAGTGTFTQTFSATTGTANTLTLSNTSGTQTNGFLINRNGASGTTTNGINITNTAGTLTNGLSFTGTIGTDIQRSSGVLTLNGNDGVSITSGAATGTTGSIFIRSGNSSSGVSGNISIDNGTTIYGTGSTIVNRTFEGCANDNMFGWYGTSSVAGNNPGAGVAHGGSCVLRVIEQGGNGGAWAIEQNAGAPTALTDGTLYTVSAWVRTAAGSMPIFGYVSTSAGDFNLTTVTAVSTGWTLMTGSFVAPPGVGNAVTIFGSSSGTGASTIYFDDITIVGGAASPSINVGTTNAQAINIGNGNMQGGITVTSGTGGITLNGNTTIGADKTFTANGSALFKNSTNSTTAFQVQNAAGTGAIIVDTTADTGNLITNGNFEQNTTGWANKTGSTVSQTTASAFFGSASLSVATAASANSGARYDVTLSANTQYTVNFMARAVGSNFSTLSYGYAADGSTETDCRTGQNPVTGGFKMFNCTFTTPGTISGTPYFYIKQSDATARTFYIDAVQLRAGSSAGVFRETGIQFGAAITSPVGIQTTVDTTLAFNVESADGSTVLVADTLNKRVGIGTQAPSAYLHVARTTSDDSIVMARINTTSTQTGNLLEFYNDTSSSVLTAFGADASLSIKQRSNSTTALTVVDDDGDSIFGVDASNRKVTVGNFTDGTGIGQLMVRPTAAGRVGLSIVPAASATANALEVYTAGFSPAGASSTDNVTFRISETGVIGSPGSSTMTTRDSSFRSGDTSFAGGATGVVTVQSGANTNSGSTGATNLLTGNATSGASGAININTGSGTTTVGAININPGVSSNNSGAGANTNVSGGDISGTTTAVGGELNLTGGDATGASGTRTGGAVYILGGTGATAHGAVNIQTGTSTGTVNIGNNAVGLVSINSGTAGINIASNGIANTVQIGNTTGAVAQTINIGNNATASSTTTLSIGSSIGTSSTTIRGGGSGTSLSLTSGANASFTANGTITITAGGGSTWSTTSGALTLRGESTLNLESSAASSTVNLGQNNATTINIGQGSNIARTINIGNAGTSQTQALTIGSTGGSSSITLQAAGAISANATGIRFTEVTGTRTIDVAARSTNVAGTGLTIAAGAGGAGATGVAGGSVTINGGNAAGTTGNANGGNVTIAGGTGVNSGSKGSVILSTTTFDSASIVTLGSTGVNAIAQANVDNFATIPITTSQTGAIASIPDPTNSSFIGRILYVAARSGSNDFTLRMNATRTAIDINLKANSTATLIWNGTDWTAAGASSATDLQAAYNNTQTSAGGAEIVLKSTLDTPAGTGGLTLRNSSSLPINGGLLEVQSAIGSNLFSVNDYATEYATNGGAETQGVSATTFAAGNWSAAPAGGTVSRTITAGQFTTGTAGVSVVTTGTANHGARDTLSTTLAINTTYNVSFTAKLSSGTFNDLTVVYSRDGTNTATNTCSTNLGSVTTWTLSTTVWSKITCTFTTPASGITASNAVFIRQNTGTARTFYIDNLSVTTNTSTSTPANVQIGGGLFGGQPTLLTLDQLSAAPVPSGNSTYYGSMYYDTTTGRIQCYEADGWGACGSAPDNIIVLTPEYPNAVLGAPGTLGGSLTATGVGTLTADFCATQTGTLEVNTSFCASGLSRNYYRWTSPQPSDQTYSIYVSYKLPSTFSNFYDNNTVKLTALRDSTNASANLSVFRSSGSAITQCGSTTTINSSTNTWETTSLTGNEQSCSFTGGDVIVFKINVTAKSNASVYVENLEFRFTNV